MYKYITLLNVLHITYADDMHVLVSSDILNDDDDEILSISGVISQLLRR